MTFKFLSNMTFALVFTSILGVGAPAAENTNTTVTIKKGDDPDFTIVADTAEIAGDPFVADKEARDSWKAACDEWKKELKELNKNNEIIAMNCGVAKAENGVNSATIYTSQGTYKIRVRIRAESKSK